MPELPVTRARLPDAAALGERLADVLASGWLTNNGACVQELEQQLRDRLSVSALHLVASGTDGLQIALRALNVRGDVLTTALSFVATASAVAWVGCRPIMVDVDPRTWNLDPTLLEAAIGPRTGAILATHLFGNPAATQAIEKIAARHGLPVIYDAAHAFDTTVGGRSILEAGDASVLSLHATKVFHTVEGGAVISGTAATSDRVESMRNFGLVGGDRGVRDLGINSKMSELHAAVGLCLLPGTAVAIARRGAVCAVYDSYFADETLIEQQHFAPEVRRNHAYYSVLLEDEETVLRVQNALRQIGVQARRYFFPALSTIPFTAGTAPVAEDLARRLLCLPVWDDLSSDDAARIARTTLSALRRC